MFELNAVLSSFLNNVLLFVTYIQGISVCMLCMLENVRDYNTCGEKKIVWKSKIAIHIK